MNTNDQGAPNCDHSVYTVSTSWRGWTKTCNLCGAVLADEPSPILPKDDKAIAPGQAPLAFGGERNQTVAPLVWSAEDPAVAGWYWHTWKAYGGDPWQQPEVWHVEHGLSCFGDVCLHVETVPLDALMDECFQKWMGPLPLPPAETAPGVGSAECGAVAEDAPKANGGGPAHEDPR